MQTCDDDRKLAKQINKQDPFQWPSEYHYKLGKNCTFNFRASTINLLLKINGY